MTYIDNVVGVDHKHAEVVQAVMPEESRPHIPPHRSHLRWLWWLAALLALSAIAWIFTRTTAEPAGVETFDRVQVESALQTLAARVSSAVNDPNAPTATVPEEQPNAEFAVPSFQLPVGVPETAEISHEKAVLSALIPYFGSFLADHPELNAVYFGSESGLLMRYMMPTVIDPEFDPRVRPWYQDTVDADGQVYWTYPYTDAFTGLQVVTASLPIHANDGTLLGVVAVDALVEVN